MTMIRSTPISRFFRHQISGGLRIKDRWKIGYAQGIIPFLGNSTQYYLAPGFLFAGPTGTPGGANLSTASTMKCRVESSLFFDVVYWLNDWGNRWNNGNVDRSGAYANYIPRSGFSDRTALDVGRPSHRSYRGANPMAYPFEVVPGEYRWANTEWSKSRVIASVNACYARDKLKFLNLTGSLVHFADRDVTLSEYAPPTAYSDYLVWFALSQMVGTMLDSNGNPLSKAWDQQNATGRVVKATNKYLLDTILTQGSNAVAEFTDFYGIELFPERGPTNSVIRSADPQVGGDGARTEIPMAFDFPADAAMLSRVATLTGRFKSLACVIAQTPDQSGRTDLSLDDDIRSTEVVAGSTAYSGIRCKSWFEADSTLVQSIDRTPYICKPTNLLIERLEEIPSPIHLPLYKLQSKTRLSILKGATLSCEIGSSARNDSVYTDLKGDILPPIDENFDPQNIKIAGDWLYASLFMDVETLAFNFKYHVNAMAEEIIASGGLTVGSDMVIRRNVDLLPEWAHISPPPAVYWLQDASAIVFCSDHLRAFLKSQSALEGVDLDRLRFKVDLFTDTSLSFLDKGDLIFQSVRTISDKSKERVKIPIKSPSYYRSLVAAIMEWSMDDEFPVRIDGNGFLVFDVPDEVVIAKLVSNPALVDANGVPFLYGVSVEEDLVVYENVVFTREEWARHVLNELRYAEAEGAISSALAVSVMSQGSTDGSMSPNSTRANVFMWIIAILAILSTIVGVITDRKR